MTKEMGPLDDHRALVRSERSTRTGPGLRLQILVALAGVILVAYVPLFFAIAQVTRGASLAHREDGARHLGRAIAAHVADIQSDDTKALDQTIATHVGEGGAIAIAVLSEDGRLLASGGSVEAVSSLRALAQPHSTTARVPSRTGHAIDVSMRSNDGGSIVVRVRTEDDAVRTAQLVRGIALYMFVFALGLLVFAYIVLTRAIVRPIEKLARAADRVASGARNLELPTSAAREVAQLGSSVRAMTARLLDEERALRSKVEELTTTTKRLGETREQLAGSERMASIGRLAAGVAHEIGNPIAAIMGMHDLIDDAETTEDVRTDFLRRMRKETERIHFVVRDLLDYTRPESPPDSARSVTASVSEVLDDVLHLVRPQKDFKEIVIRIDVASDLSAALSPQRLTQVLLNILFNAGASLANVPVGTQRAIVVRARRIERSVRIEIEDNGPGVPKDIAARIFDPFVTTKDVGAGTGLGLAVCRGIVEGAKGRIFLDPSYADGARFVIDLPAPPTDASP